MLVNCDEYKYDVEFRDKFAFSIPKMKVKRQLKRISCRFALKWVGKCSK